MDIRWVFLLLLPFLAFIPGKGSVFMNTFYESYYDNSFQASNITNSTLPAFVPQVGEFLATIFLSIVIAFGLGMVVSAVATHIFMYYRMRAQEYKHFVEKTGLQQNVAFIERLYDHHTGISRGNGTDSTGLYPPPSTKRQRVMDNTDVDMFYHGTTMANEAREWKRKFNAKVRECMTKTVTINHLRAHIVQLGLHLEFTMTSQEILDVMEEHGYNRYMRGPEGFFTNYNCAEIARTFRLLEANEEAETANTKTRKPTGGDGTGEEWVFVDRSRHGVLD